MANEMMELEQRLAVARVLHGTKIFENPLTMTEAVQAANLDYDIRTVRPTFKSLAGQVVKVDSRVRLIVRVDADGTETAIGATGDRFKPVTNAMLANSFEAVTKKYPVIAAAEHQNRSYFCLDAGVSKLANEEHQNYLWIMDPKNGTGALRMIWTPTRMLCWNMQITAMRTASFKMNMVHLGNVESKLNVLSTVMYKVEEAQTKVYDSFNLMAAAQFSIEDRKSLVEAVYPSRREEIDTTSAYYKNLQALRDGAMTRMTLFDDVNSKYAGTAWAAYNGVTEFSDWRSGRGHVQFSTLTGQRAADKETAFNYIMSHITT